MLQYKAQNRVKFAEHFGPRGRFQSHWIGARGAGEGKPKPRELGHYRPEPQAGTRGDVSLRANLEPACEG